MSPMKPEHIIAIAARCFLVLLGLSRIGSAFGQVVEVSVKLDTNSVAVGETTTLRVLAQVAPAQQGNAERIFSWYVDVVNTNPAAAAANYGAMMKTASDQDALTSSTGVSQQGNRRGIYDTFLNAATGTGVSAPVELMAIPVSGLARGTTRFVVSAGTGVPQLTSDFLVSPLQGARPMTGGRYARAYADLAVTGPGSGRPSVNLMIATKRLAGDPTQSTVTYPPPPNHNCYMEYRSGIGVGAWQTLPGGPHNSGMVVDVTTNRSRIFRLRMEPLVP
jgi:hypothetical protein